METPFFSIIIPVYNGLSHDLPPCLDSIWQQPLDKSLYEVICVDDCSTDGTREWLDEQQKTYSNLRVAKNGVNIRQGGGRNRGVKEAKGKYILFIDQDDYYHKGSLASVYKHLLENPDIEVFVSDSAWQFKGHESNKLQLNLPYKEVCSGWEFIKQNGAIFAPWRMCIQRSFYLEYDLKFPERCRIEDVDWACRVLYYAKRMQYAPILLVHYIKAESGQTDNMYRNEEILRANTIAGNRTWEVATTLYVDSPVQDSIKNIAEMYYNYSCRYLFGMLKRVKVKRGIIGLIAISDSRYPLVNFALKHTTLFCVLSNLGVPAFRVLRIMKRWVKARQLED